MESINMVLNTGLLFTCFLSAFLIYTPYINRALNLVGLRISWFMVALPFAWMIFFYDEFRRAIMRANPTGWVYKETYY